MASKVYFADLRARSPQESTISKIQKLFDEAGFVELLGAEDLTAIKIHFGEYGNDSYINPVFVRQVVEKIRASGADLKHVSTEVLPKSASIGCFSSTSEDSVQTVLLKLSCRGRQRRHDLYLTCKRCFGSCGMGLI